MGDDLRHLRKAFRKALGGPVPGYKDGGLRLHFGDTDKDVADYVDKFPQGALPAPTLEGLKEAAKSLVRPTARLSQKYGPSYLPLDALRDAAALIPGEGKGLAYSLDDIVDAAVPALRNESSEFARAGYNPLQYGLNAVDRAGNYVSRALQGLPAAADMLTDVASGARDLAGYAGGGPIQKSFSFMRSKLNNLRPWMKGAAAVDEKGAPLKLFHASPEDIHQFEVGRPNTYSTTLGPYTSSNSAVFLAEHPELANYYAETVPGKYKSNSSVYPVYTNVKRPVDFRNGVPNDVYTGLKEQGLNPYYPWHDTELWQMFEKENGGDDLVTALKKLGYDSARLTEYHPDGLPNQSSWAIFDPTSIKSIFNRGSFDSSDPRGIGYADGGPVSIPGGPPDIWSSPPQFDFQTPGSSHNTPAAKVYAGGGRVSKFIEALKDAQGLFAGRRAEKAADLTNLERYSNKGLGELFDPDTSSLLAAIKPGDFQKFSVPIGPTTSAKVPYPRWFNMPSKQRAGLQPTQDNYISRLSDFINKKGLDEPPTLWMYKNLDNGTAVEGHEGRHRMMAMDRLNDPASLVRLNPARAGELLSRPDLEDRLGFLSDKYFPLGKYTPITQEASGVYNDTVGAPRPLGAEPFAEGGLKRIGKAALRGIEDFAKRASEISGPDTGFTWHPMTGETPTKGFAASIFPDRGEVLEPGPVDPQRLRAYAEKNKDLLGDSSNYLGAWNDPASGKVYLDISKVDPDEIRLSQAARNANQLAYFDLENMRSLPLDADSLYADGGDVKGPVLGAGIQWIKDLADMFGKASRTAGQNVRQNAERYGKEALSFGNKYTDPRDLPFVRGEQTRVPVDVDTGARINSLPWMHDFFTVHSHPKVTGSNFGQPSASAALAAQGIPADPHPSVGDLQMLKVFNPSRHAMMIEAAGQPDMRTVLRSTDPHANDISSAIGYLRGRMPQHFTDLADADPRAALTQKLRAAHREFGLDPRDTTPLSGIYNTAIANRGMNVFMDPAGMTTGGMSLQDLLPEYTKFLGTDLPESWKARGGSIPGYAGGSRVTKLAEEAMERLAKLRGERFQAEKAMGAGDADARRAANDVFLEPDKRLQKNYVSDPLRLSFPGIYKDPRDIASEASDLALSKSPDLGKESSLYRATGLTRDDLYDYGKDSIDRLPTDVPPQMPGPRVRGSKISGNALTDAMRQHQLDVLRESMGYSHVFKPSAAWYEMGPIWDIARDKAGLSMPDMRQLNQFMGIHSPASSPVEEMKRGLAANYFLKQGRLDDYIKYGVNTDATKRLPGYPNDFRDVPGHFVHSTAHVPNLLKSISDPDTWLQDANTIKVPHYIAATDPAGAYLDRPVADSHFARGLGFPDVRTASRGNQLMKNLTPSEFWDTVPFYDKLSSQVGLKPVQTQALQWNVMGPQTGVRKIAVPKAEMFTDIADEHARQMGIGLDQSIIDLLRGADYPRQYRRGGDVDDDMQLYHVGFFQ